MLKVTSGISWPSRKCNVPATRFAFRPPLIPGVCTLPFLLLAALPLHAAEPLPVLHLPLDKSLAADDGVEPQSFRRMSVATRFDDTRGKLVDVPANQSRFERRAGKPWGAATGLLIEGPSENLFRNSSFELIGNRFS